MSNDYFVFDSGRMVPGEPALAEDVNAAFDAVEAGFDLIKSPDAMMFGLSNYAVATGTANTYAIPIEDAVAYEDGMEVIFKAPASNTGASTVNVNSLGAKNLRASDGSVLVLGDIQNGKIYSARYNATVGNFEMQSLTAGAASDISTVAASIDDISTVADNVDGILAAEGHSTNALGYRNEAEGFATAASGSAGAAATSAANLPNATTAGADKVIVTNATGDGWEYPVITAAGKAILDDADAEAQLATLGAASLAFVIANGVPVGCVFPFVGGYFTDGSNGGFTSVLGNSAAEVNGVVSAAGYRVCDGSALNITDSPIFNGTSRYLPNLTDDRFLMGDTTAGSVGGSSTMAHTHTGPSHTHTGPSHTHTTSPASLSTGQLASHNHNIGLAYGSTDAFVPKAGSGATATTNDYIISSTGSNQTHAHGSTGSSGTANTGASGTGNTGAASNTENRPLFLSCIYIMKVV
jgi:hypothetical protein